MCDAGGYDPHYFKSASGCLKLYCLVCEVSGIICILCSSASLGNLRGVFYISVMSFAFLCTACIYLRRLFQLRCCSKAHQHHPMLHHSAKKYKIWLNATLAVGCFIAASVALSLALVTYSIAAFFGFLTFLLYALDTWRSYKKFRMRDMSTQTAFA